MNIRNRRKYTPVILQKFIEKEKFTIISQDLLAKHK